MGRINLFNGDCAYEAWRECDLPGEALVWRENYLQGVCPLTLDLAKFCQVRAKELHRISPEKPEQEIQDELIEMNRRLLALNQDDTLILWFDVCPFDRVMLARILYLLHDLLSPPRIKLICRDVVWSPEDFRKYQHDGVFLSKNDLEYGASEWQAYLSGMAAENLMEKISKRHI